jgi:hypothetical protein
VAHADLWGSGAQLEAGGQLLGGGGVVGLAGGVVVCGRRSKTDRVVVRGAWPRRSRDVPGHLVGPFGGAGGVRVNNQETQRPGGPVMAPAGRHGGEFDPGSGSTLAACLMHASRTGAASAVSRGGRVRNTWAICPAVGASPRKRGVIPHGVPGRVGPGIKGASAPPLEEPASD